MIFPPPGALSLYSPASAHPPGPPPRRARRWCPELRRLGIPFTVPVGPLPPFLAFFAGRPASRTSGSTVPPTPVPAPMAPATPTVDPLLSTTSLPTIASLASRAAARPALPTPPPPPHPLLACCTLPVALLRGTSYLPGALNDAWAQGLATPGAAACCPMQMLDVAAATSAPAAAPRSASELAAPSSPPPGEDAHTLGNGGGGTVPPLRAGGSSCERPAADGAGTRETVVVPLMVDGASRRLARGGSFAELAAAGTGVALAALGGPAPQPQPQPQPASATALPPHLPPLLEGLRADAEVVVCADETVAINWALCRCVSSAAGAGEVPLHHSYLVDPFGALPQLEEVLLRACGGDFALDANVVGPAAAPSPARVHVAFAAADSPHCYSSLCALLAGQEPLSDGVRLLSGDEGHISNDGGGGSMTATGPLTIVLTGFCGHLDDRLLPLVTFAGLSRSVASVPLPQGLALPSAGGPAATRVLRTVRLGPTASVDRGAVSAAVLLRGDSGAPTMSAASPATATATAPAAAAVARPSSCLASRGTPASQQGVCGGEPVGLRGAAGDASPTGPSECPEAPVASAPDSDALQALFPALEPAPLDVTIDPTALRIVLHSAADNPPSPMPALRSAAAPVVFAPSLPALARVLAADAEACLAAHFAAAGASASASAASPASPAAGLSARGTRPATPGPFAFPQGCPRRRTTVHGLAAAQRVAQAAEAALVSALANDSNTAATVDTLDRIKQLWARVRASRAAWDWAARDFAEGVRERDRHVAPLCVRAAATIQGALCLGALAPDYRFGLRELRAVFVDALQRPHVAALLAAALVDDQSIALAAGATARSGSPSSAILAGAGWAARIPAAAAAATAAAAASPSPASGTRPESSASASSASSAGASSASAASSAAGAGTLLGAAGLGVDADAPAGAHGPGDEGAFLRTPTFAQLDEATRACCQAVCAALFTHVAAALHTDAHRLAFAASVAVRTAVCEGSLAPDDAASILHPTLAGPSASLPSTVASRAAPPAPPPAVPQGPSGRADEGSQTALGGAEVNPVTDPPQVGLSRTRDRSPFPQWLPDASWAAVRELARAHPTRYGHLPAQVCPVSLLHTSQKRAGKGRDNDSLAATNPGNRRASGT